MTHWWQEAVIYQIYPRSFMDASGDGVGDIPGIIARLDALAWLGVDALWISPVFRSPMADFGYDVADYRDIDPLFGTLADADRLIREAHGRGLRVLLDLVPNHTSDQHAWFIESRSSRDNPKRDWYIWRDPAPDGGPPNNWMSYFGGPAWTFDAATGQYYMHNFAPQQPELNWRNPDVEQAMHDIVRFWLDRGVDGFRLDVIDRVLKDEQFRDNPPDPDWHTGDDPTWRYQRIYSEIRPGIVDVFKRLRAVFDAYDERVMIGEIEYAPSLERIASYYGDAQPDGTTGDALHLPFNFRLIDMAWNAGVIRAYVDEYNAAIPAHGWPNYVLGNHDKPRIASKIGAGQARIAAMLLLTLRGTPTLYYGDELGMTNVPVPADRIQDPQGKGTQGFNRDECRTPMLWDDSPNSGFAPAGAEPWLPVAPDSAAIHWQAQQTDAASMLHFQRALLATRKASPALRLGEYAALDAPDAVFAYTRTHGDEARLVVMNFSNAPQTFTHEALRDAAVLVCTHMDRDGEAISGTLSLRPDEGVVLTFTRP